jgi:GAF domain-containing protein
LSRTFADQAVIAIENARLLSELRQSLEQQTATSEVLGVISNSLSDIQPVFESIVQSGVKLFSGATVSIALVDNGMVRAAAVADRDPARAEAWRSVFPFPLAREYMHSRAILDRKVLDIPDVQRASADLAVGAKNFLRSGQRAVTVVPLIQGDRAIGALSVIRLAPGPLSDKQLATLKTYADQAIIAIENTRLLNELRQRTDDLSESLEQQTATSEVLKVISSSPGELEPVFHAMLENATRLCEAKFGLLYLYEEGRLRFGAAHDVPPAFAEARGKEPFTPSPDGTTGRVVTTKQPAQVADLAATQSYSDRNPVVVAAVEVGGVRTALSVPMLKENALIGVISIYRKEVRPFTDKQTALLRNFAAQAVIAIENARLLNELRESLDHQTATADRVIAGTPEDCKRALNTIAETAVRMFDANSVNIRRIEGDVLRIIAAAGPMAPKLREALPDIPLEPTDPSVRCFLDNCQTAIDDRRAALASERGKIASVVRDIRIGSQAFTPLSRQGKAIGVMIVARTEVRPFQRSELDLMTGFADQAVIAIENARLLNELRESLERQTATSEVLSVISSSPGELQPYFRPCWRTRYEFATQSWVSCIFTGVESFVRPHWRTHRRNLKSFSKNVGSSCLIREQPSAASSKRGRRSISSMSRRSLLTSTASRSPWPPSTSEAIGRW